MLKRYIAVLLIALTLHAAGAARIYAKSVAEKDAQRASKARVAVLKLGTGEAARVKVRLTDGRRIEGFVSAAGEDNFVITNPETSVTTIVAYPQVGQVKRNNLSKGAWITIGVLAAVGVAVAVAVLTRCGNEGNC